MIIRWSSVVCQRGRRRGHRARQSARARRQRLSYIHTSLRALTNMMEDVAGCLLQMNVKTLPTCRMLPFARWRRAVPKMRCRVAQCAQNRQQMFIVHAAQSPANAGHQLRGLSCFMKMRLRFQAGCRGSPLRLRPCGVTPHLTSLMAGHGFKYLVLLAVLAAALLYVACCSRRRRCRCCVCCWASCEIFVFCCCFVCDYGAGLLGCGCQCC